MYDRNKSHASASVIPLARVSPAEILRSDTDCRAIINCFDFRPGEEQSHLPSAVLRWFKSQPCQPKPGPQLKAFSQQCTELIYPRVNQPDCIITVFSSWQKIFAPESPLGQLASQLAKLTNAEIIHPIRRTDPRRPMSTTSSLSGPEALMSRIRYISSTLICEKTDLTGKSILALDDIGCTGATRILHAWVLKQLCNCKDITWVNLGQASGFASQDTLFDLADLPAHKDVKSFQKHVWWDKEQEVYHLRPDCSNALTGRQLWWKGLTGHSTVPCRICT